MIESDFIFLGHALDEQHLRMGASLLGITVKQAIKNGPVLLEEVIDRKHKLKGHVIASPMLPIDFMVKRNVIDQLERIKELVETTFIGNPPIGLGGFWATATRSGLLAREIIKDHEIIDGYTGTVNKIVQQVNENWKNGRIFIIGAGNVGQRVYKKLKNKYYIELFDKHNIKKLNEIGLPVNNIKTFDINNGYGLGICCISGVEKLFNLEDIPEGMKIIDDSYPHVVPDYPGRIDGGMYYCPDIISPTVFVNGNIYGCAMELIDSVRNSLCKDCGSKMRLIRETSAITCDKCNYTEYIGKQGK